MSDVRKLIDAWERATGNDPHTSLAVQSAGDDLMKVLREFEATIRAIRDRSAATLRARPMARTYGLDSVETIIDLCDQALATWPFEEPKNARRGTLGEGQI